MRRVKDSKCARQHAFEYPRFFFTDNEYDKPTFLVKKHPQYNTILCGMSFEK